MISITNNIQLLPPLFGIFISKDEGTVSSLVGTSLTFEAFVPVHSVIDGSVGGNEVASRYDRTITHLGNPEKVQDLNLSYPQDTTHLITEYTNKSIITQTRLNVEPLPAGMSVSVYIATPISSERAYMYVNHVWVTLKDDVNVIHNGTVWGTTPDAVENLQIYPKFWLAEVPTTGFSEKIFTKTLITSTISGLEQRKNSELFSANFEYSFTAYGKTAERYKNIGLIKDISAFVQVDWRYPTANVPFGGGVPNTDYTRYIRGSAVVGEKLAVLLDSYTCYIGEVVEVNVVGVWYIIRFATVFPVGEEILYILPTLNCELVKISEEIINMETSTFSLEVKIK